MTVEQMDQAIDWIDNHTARAAAAAAAAEEEG